MAITFVPCKDKEHAIACREMGLLYINFSSQADAEWELAMGCNTAWVQSMYNPNAYASDGPRPYDFGIALED